MGYDSTVTHSPAASVWERAPTYIPGLDEILEGGLPRGRTTVVNGGPGSGKTLRALEFLYRGVLAGEPGITILLVNQTTGIGGITEISGNGISSMVDTVIRLDYEEDYGETTRLLQVLKSRGSAHSNQKREYVITDEGIRNVDVYVGEGDALTGTARQVQEEKDRIEALRLDFEIRMKEIELQRLQLMKKQATNGIAQRSAMRGMTAPSERPEDAPQERGPTAEGAGGLSYER